MSWLEITQSVSWITIHCDISSIHFDSRSSFISWFRICFSHLDGRHIFISIIITRKPLYILFLFIIHCDLFEFLEFMLISMLMTQAGDDVSDQCSNNKCDNKCSHNTDNNYEFCRELIII